MTRRIALAALAVFAAAAPAATAATAPGRVAFAFSEALESYAGSSGVDAHGSVALPDGGVVTLEHDAAGGSALAVRLRADGSLDGSFGSAGIARIPVPGAGFRAHHIMRLADGRLLIAGSQPESPFRPGRLVVVRLLADGALDPGFGSGGVVSTSLLALVFSSPMALGPDGSIVVTGDLPRAADPDWSAPSDWAVAKLSPDGVPDPGFGVVKVPVAGDRTRALGVAVTPTGSIVTLGAALSPAGEAGYLVGLTALGAPDPTFNGGAPANIQLAAPMRLYRRANGAWDVLGGQAIVRFDAHGARDASYGSGGTVALPARGNETQSLVALPDGGWLVVAQKESFDATPLESRLSVRRLTGNGVVTGATAALQTPFGGGFSSPHKKTRGSVAQNSFRGELLRRDDGSFVAIGRVMVNTPYGKMEGEFAQFVAAAAFTRQLAPDPSFGGPRRPPVLDVRVRRRRAVDSARQRAILVRVDAPEAGLVLLRVRDARGRLLGGSLQPVYRPGATTMQIGLTSAGTRRLRAARRGLRISVRHEFRDIVAGTDTGVTRGRLR